MGGENQPFLGGKSKGKARKKPSFIMIREKWKNEK